MAEIIIRCPHCNVELQAQKEWIGMEVECPLCKQKIIIPAGTIASAPILQPSPVQKSEFKVKLHELYNLVKTHKRTSLAAAIGVFAVGIALFLVSGKEQEVDQKDLFTHNDKYYYLKLSNGPFSGIAIEKDGNWIRRITHYKNGFRHGRDFRDDTGFEEEQYWKNGKMHGPYLCVFKRLASDEIWTTVKGQYKNSARVGKWKYTRFKNDDMPQYELTWSYNNKGELHGLCQTPFFLNSKAPYRLCPDPEGFFRVYNAAARFRATYAEAEFSHGTRTSNGKMIKISPTGKRVEIPY